MIKKEYLKFLTVIVIVSCLEGCASFDKKEMAVTDYNAVKSYPHSLSVSVGTGSEDSDVGLIPVPRQDLKFAIEDSIRNSEVFEKIVSGEDGDYLLNVTVFILEQPALGFNMTVKMEAGWTLKKAGGDVVWQKVIKSKYTARVSEAFVGMIRLRKANDGAIRENIRQGLEQMSHLNL